ncbi:MAG: ligase-associated DNA damage response endonuclease PdeM [Bacteroidia bacterium]|nr:ligase-associated DNA damage response endonuclease PdeM [Bacteroidia bacterium]
MAEYLDLQVEGETLRLLPQRAVYWPRQQALLLADLHLGKAAHFRRHGIPLPAGAIERDLAQLDALLRACPEAEQLIVLGDLFHSAHNAEWEQFGAWLAAQPHTCTLIRGNHDLLEPARYAALGIGVLEAWDLGPFRLLHEAPAEPGEQEPYTLSGHVHPGILLEGLGRQRLRLPCFWFGARGGVLPAFGALTGLARILPAPGDCIAAAADGQVMLVQRGRTV